MKSIGFTRLSTKLLAIFILILGVTLIGLFSIIESRKYFDERKNLVSNLQELIKTQSAPISTALWEVDKQKIDFFLSEVKKLNFIQGVVVTNTSGEIVASTGDIDTPAKRPEFVAQTPLIFGSGEKPMTLGLIKVIVHDQEILRNLKHRLVNDAIILLVLMLVLSASTFLVTNLFVGRPLRLLLASIQKTRREGEREPVDWDSGDELGQVIGAYNDVQLAVERSHLFRLLGRIAEHANTAVSFEEAVRQSLKDVCAFMEWPVGHALIRAPKGVERLVPTGIWHLDDPVRFREFREVTEETEFASGIGLPGRVYASGQPEWIADVIVDPNFPRASKAKDLGIRAGFALPVLVGTKVEAVLEFFTDKPTDLDEDMLMMLFQIGAQLGRVLERDRAANALRESRDIFQALADNLPDVIVMKDVEGRFLFANKAFEEWTDTIRNKIEGKTAHDIYARDQAKEITERDRNVLESQTNNTIESTFAWPDGKTRTVIATKFPITASDGALLGLGHINHDITERKRTEEEKLRQAQKMEVLGQLTGSVAHDFNNVLTVLDCNIELLKSQFDEGRQSPALIDNCAEAVELGSNLTRRLTKFARKEPQAVTRVDLKTLIVGFSDLLDRSVGTDHSIAFDLPDEPLPVVVDVVLLEMALLNLVVNARDAMTDGGVIMVGLTKTDPDGEPESFSIGSPESRPYALLQVSDSGVGMAPEVRERVFQSFFTTKPEGEGTGLGLSTVNDLAQGSSGLVQIESKVGKGTSVKIFFPIDEEYAVPA